MQQDETLKVAIAETSVIIRSGLALVLKRVQGMKILPIEIASPDTLSDCIRLHKPDILIINPSFPGYFDIQKFREDTSDYNIKCVALLCSVGDQSLLRYYDDTFSL